MANPQKRVPENIPGDFFMVEITSHNRRGIVA